MFFWDTSLTLFSTTMPCIVCIMLRYRATYLLLLPLYLIPFSLMAIITCHIIPTILSVKFIVSRVSPPPWVMVRRFPSKRISLYRNHLQRMKDKWMDSSMWIVIRWSWSAIFLLSFSRTFGYFLASIPRWTMRRGIAAAAGVVWQAVITMFCSFPAAFPVF